MSDQRSADDLYVVQGGASLHGTVRVPGAKNSALKLIAASLLTDEPVTIRNLPDIADIPVMVDLARSLGSTATFDGDGVTLVGQGRVGHEPDPEGMAAIRASVSLLGPLVGRARRARLAWPGGDRIGKRAIDFHLGGLSAMGAEVVEREDHFEVFADDLHGAAITLEFPSVGATENLVMAAVLADGVTVIDNAAREPEVQDLCRMLFAMGAVIEGIGTSRLEVTGVEELGGVTWHTVPDRIQAATWAVAAAVTGGTIRIEGARPSDLRLVVSKLRAAGAVVDEEPDALVAKGGHLQACNFVTLPYPGFPTDMQPQMMVLLTQAEGASRCTENVFESRFSFVDELSRMGADISLDGHHAVIRGPVSLHGTRLNALDVRAGAAGVLAGLVASGETVVTDIHHVDRGYHDFDATLRRLGADVRRASSVRERSRTVVLAVVIVGVLTGGAGVPVGAQEDSAGPVDLGMQDTPVRFVADDGVTMELGSGRRLVDTMELRPSPAGGMVVVAEMGMEDYVTGVAEMPARWPMAALKAQAVAARTYAWYQASLHTFEERGLGYDICASTACQVFEGQSVVEEPVVGQRWQRAVRETAGEVLLHEGEPILAWYFSTSGGRTRDNEDIFPSSGPRPYLKGIEDPDDAVSPLHRWQVTFTREQFDELLSRGQTLGPTTPVRDVQVVPRGGSAPNEVVVTGQDGTTAQVTTGALRRFLNDVAPELFPDAFPGPRPDGGTLPTTVPSSRFEVEVTEQEVVLHGSGWGHGVGMGQYGAKGKAERGLDHVEILSTYYNGLTPTTTPRLPDRIRVGLADDAQEVAISADDRMQVAAGGEQLTDRAFGTWRVQAVGDGAIRVMAPASYGAPLAVEPTTTTRAHPLTVETLTLEAVVNKPTELVVEVARDGQPVGRRSVGIVDQGDTACRGALETADGPVEPGTYDVRLLGIDEDGTTAGSPATVEVQPVHARGRPPSVLSTPVEVRVGGTRVPLAGVLSGLLVGLLAGALTDRRRRVAA